jgi:hypothetical protein
VSAVLALAFFAYCGSYAGEMRASSDREAAIEPVEHTSDDALPDPSIDFDFTETQSDAEIVQIEREQGAADGLSFFFAQLNGVLNTTLNISPRVESVLTPWAEPWNHGQICRRMNEILIENGVESRQMRIRMIAHAIVASGWRQNVWNYNAWGVQQGSWTGPWYVRSTQEADDDGNLYTVWDAAWRSFESWEESIGDYLSRISPDSPREPYRQAYRYAVDPNNFRADKLFWDSLREGRYYTAQHFTTIIFATLCGRVRQELAAAQ